MNITVKSAYYPSCAGSHAGRTPDTIIRRLFGRDAVIRPSRDPNSTSDMILRPDRSQVAAYHVLGTVVHS